MKRGDRVALEATTNTWPVVEILRPFVAEIVVGNAMKTRAIAEAKVKTDKVDAEVLAQLLRWRSPMEPSGPDNNGVHCEDLDGDGRTEVLGTIFKFSTPKRVVERISRSSIRRFTARSRTRCAATRFASIIRTDWHIARRSSI